jgi:RNA polymerase-binding transcription factor DksA
MAKAKVKPKAKEAVKPAAKPVAKAKPVVKAKPAPPAKAAKPATGRTEKPKTATIEKKPAAAAKPGTGRIEKPKAAGKGTAAIAKPTTRPPKTDRIERPSKIPVVNRAELKGLTSPFDRHQLREWRGLLIDKRSEITNDIAGLVKDAMEAEDGHTTPNHIAERGSDADLQEFSLGMAGEEKVELWLIDRALRKIDEQLPVPFGLCEYTKQGIQKSRLELLPWTPLSIEGAQYMEENRLTLEDMLIDD